jgi:hypothetical protein
VKQALVDRLRRLEWAARRPHDPAGSMKSTPPSLERTLAVLTAMEECATIPVSVAEYLSDAMGIDATDNGRLRAV